MHTNISCKIIVKRYYYRLLEKKKENVLEKERKRTLAIINSSLADLTNSNGRDINKVAIGR